jgi:hypothetical protein
MYLYEWDSFVDTLERFVRTSGITEVVVQDAELVPWSHQWQMARIASASRIPVRLRCRQPQYVIDSLTPFLAAAP